MTTVSHDLSECTCKGTVPESHIHCMSDGSVLYLDGDGGYSDAITCKRCDEHVCDNASCTVVRCGERVCVPCARELDRGLGWNEFPGYLERWSVKCSGCGLLISCSRDELPANANRCSCGAIKHIECGCSAWTPPGDNGHELSLAERNATETLDDLNHTLNLLSRSSDLDERERVSPILAAIAARATTAIGENAIAIAHGLSVPLGLAS